jgi:hypothetical protein
MGEIRKSADERRIIAAGEKLAAQMGAVFRIVPQKLNDYRARAAALRSDSPTSSRTLDSEQAPSPSPRR